MARIGDLQLKRPSLGFPTSIYPYVAPHTAKIHTLITLGIRLFSQSACSSRVRMRRPRLGSIPIARSTFRCLASLCVASARDLAERPVSHSLDMWPNRSLDRMLRSASGPAAALTCASVTHSHGATEPANAEDADITEASSAVAKHSPSLLMTIPPGEKLSIQFDNTIRSLAARQQSIARRRSRL